MLVVAPRVDFVGFLVGRYECVCMYEGMNEWRLQWHCKSKMCKIDGVLRIMGLILWHLSPGLVVRAVNNGLMPYFFVPDWSRPDAGVWADTSECMKA